MEEKLKRESKDYVQKIFKKLDRNGAAAIHRDDLNKVLFAVLPEWKPDLNKEELKELLAQHVKVTKYTQHNKVTNQFEVKYQDNTLDFPSVLAIVVHFLKKEERKTSNAFSGLSMVKYKDFTNDEKARMNGNAEIKKRLF